MKPFVLRLPLFVSLLAVSLLAPQVLAQTTAQLSGTVMDSTSAVIPHATVIIYNKDEGSRRTIYTSSSGQYTAVALPSGHYNITVQAKGFETLVTDDVKLDVAQAGTLDFKLKAGSTRQVVTVNGSGTALNTTDGTVSTVIDRQLIENMPLNGKDLQTLFELSPGTILNAGGSPSNGGGFSVDGQRPTANYLTIDGASGNAYVPISGPGANGNVTGASIATSASGGTTGILPIDAIEEYRMDTSTYTAENGRTPGGQIQVRTRSGTNEFHGTLFENFRNQVLDATDWFAKYDDLAQTPLRMNDFGGTVGGPILKDKLFFFVAHDTLLLNQPSETTEQDVPSASVVQQAYSPFRTFLAAFPAGNTKSSDASCPASDPYCDPSNPGFDFFDASYSYLVRNHTTSVRLDEQLPRSIHAFFRSNIAPSSSYLPGIQSEGSKVNIYTYTGGVTIPIASRMVNELTLNHTSTDTESKNQVGSVGGNNPNAIADNLPAGVNLATDNFEYAIASSGFATVVGATSGPNELNSLHQWNVVDSFSLQLKSHTLKFGVDVLTHNSQIHEYANAYTVGVELSSTMPYTDLDTGVATLVDYSHNNAQPNIETNDTSLYVNDDWRIQRSLRVNLGLRWEYNPSPTVNPFGILAVEGTNLNPETIQASVSNKPLYKTSYDNFAPRFGFAWSPSNGLLGHTVVRGGVGIYFDTGQAATAAEAAIGGYPYQSGGEGANLAYSSISFPSLASSASPNKLPTSPVYLVNPSLISPRTYEWSLTIEHQLGKNTKLSTSYVGNDGEKLIGNEETYNFKNTAGQYPVNPNLVSSKGYLYILTNQTHSNYQALQVQLTSTIGSRLSALASYTWGHAEDNGSSDFSSVGAAAINPIANSANDIRQIFAAAIHYAPAGVPGNRIFRAVMEGWGFDTIARLQTALPLTVNVNNLAEGNINSFLANANVVPGQPSTLHEHIDSYGKVVPGNKLLNWAAFTTPPVDSSGAFLQQGNSPTNGYRLFGLSQWDLALSRTWKLRRELNLNFRVDAFNVLNAVNFAEVNTPWSSTDASTFGRASSTYANNYGAQPSSFGASGSQLSIFQNGGPREVELSMKLKF